MTVTPRNFALTASVALAALIYTGENGLAQAPDGNSETDMGAKTFVQSCLRCHGGILTGNDLMNTGLSSVENLTQTVHRMQQFTPPLSQEQVTALVELLKDKEVQFRVQDAQLEQTEQTAQDTTADATGPSATIPQDEGAALFIKNCALCHTIGPGSSTGGDLTRTIDQSESVVKANVIRMQVRTGPLTTDQVDQLTALLKDKNRNARLASAGYKPPVAQIRAPARITAPASAQIRPVASDHGAEHPKGVPMDIMALTIGLGALVSAAGYVMARLCKG